jgi:hypothetical protein
MGQEVHFLVWIARDKIQRHRLKHYHQIDIPQEEDKEDGLGSERMKWNN